MKIKNIIYLTLILSISNQTHSMKRALSNPSASDRVTKKIVPNGPISKIAAQIYMDTDPIIMVEQLSQPQARLINHEDRENLYIQAQAFEALLTTSPEDPFHTRVTAKKNILYAFKFFPQLTFPQAFFNPVPYKRMIDKRPHLNQIIEALIKNEQEKIYVCCFHLTLTSIAESLLDQKEKGISVEIITNQNQGKTQDAWWALMNLKDNNIPVLSPQNDKFEQMHHKFFIFKKNMLNKSLIALGSYNPTPHGDINSWDDLIVLDNPEIIENYIKRFEEVKSRSK